MGFFIFQVRQVAPLLRPGRMSGNGQAFRFRLARLLPYGRYDL